MRYAGREVLDERCWTRCAVQAVLDKVCCTRGVGQGVLYKRCWTRCAVQAVLDKVRCTSGVGQGALYKRCGTRGRAQCVGAGVEGPCITFNDEIQIIQHCTCHVSKMILLYFLRPNLHAPLPHTWPPQLHLVRGTPEATRPAPRPTPRPTPHPTPHPTPTPTCTHSCTWSVNTTPPDPKIYPTPHPTPLTPHTFPDTSHLHTQLHMVGEHQRPERQAVWTDRCEQDARHLGVQHGAAGRQVVGGGSGGGGHDQAVALRMHTCKIGQRCVWDVRVEECGEVQGSVESVGREQPSIQSA